MKTLYTPEEKNIEPRREAELQAEQEIRDIREAKLERAFTRLAQFEFQATPPTPEEGWESEAALAIITEIEAQDEDLVNYMENYVFDKYRDDEMSQDDQFDIER